MAVNTTASTFSYTWEWRSALEQFFFGLPNPRAVASHTQTMSEEGFDHSDVTMSASLQERSSSGRGQNSSVPPTSLTGRSSWLSFSFYRNMFQSTGDQNVRPTASTSESSSASALSQRMNSHEVEDLQVLTRWIERLTPFIILILILNLEDHILSISHLVLTQRVLFYANEKLKKYIASKDPMFMAIVQIALSVLMVHAMGLAVCSVPKYYRTLALLSPIEPLKMVEAVLYMAIMDTTVKVVAVIVKLWIVVWDDRTFVTPATIRHLLRKLNVFEHILHIYRSLLPIPIWTRYFFAFSNSSFTGYIFAAFYWGMKTSYFLKACTRLLSALRVMRHTGAAFGEYAQPQDLMEAGQSCSICHDTFVVPVRLSCAHVFCEECISEWIDRHPTCPMCRVSVALPGTSITTQGTSSHYPMIF